LENNVLFVNPAEHHHRADENAGGIIEDRLQERDYGKNKQVLKDCNLRFRCPAVVHFVPPKFIGELRWFGVTIDDDALYSREFGKVTPMLACQRTTENRVVSATGRNPGFRGRLEVWLRYPYRPGDR